MADQLLISFCNFKSDRPSGWLLVQTEPFSATWVIPAGLPLISSCTGLTLSDGKIFCTGHKNKRGFIAVLDEKTWELLKYHEISDLVDPHSIILCDDQLHVVNTGRDQVCRLDWTAAAPKLKSIWKLGKGESDDHHINGLCLYSGNLVCSFFGPKPNAGWKHAHEGRIFDITNRTEIVSQIHHPHSVTPDFEGNLIWCESREGRVQNQHGSAIATIDGYVRGLCFAAPDRIWVATSRQRTKSKSTGHHLETPNPPSAVQCGIHYLDPTHSEPIKHIDLSSFGDEIYDIIRLSKPPKISVKTKWEIRYHEHVRNLETKCEQGRAWGSDLQNELQRTRDEVRRIQTDFKEQLIWAQSLQKELEGTQKEFHRVTKLSDERTAWATLLAQELEQTKSEFGKVSQLALERTKWAQKSKKELDRVKKLSDERTAWANSLVQELERTKSEFEKASQLARERTNWAQDSLVEIDRGRFVIGKLTKQLEACSVYLLDLENTSDLFREKLANILTLIEANTDQQRIEGDLLAPRNYSHLNVEELLNQTAVMMTQLQSNYAGLSQQLRDGTDELSRLEQHQELTNSEIDWLRAQLSRILTARQKFHSDNGLTD